MKERIGKIFLIIIACVLTTLFSSCQKNNKDKLNSDDILRLKDKYDIAAINYFYETVFHEDENDTNLDNLLKWKADPKIVLVGNPSPKEIDYVKNVILRINKLNLPIKCTLENKSDTNTIEVFFGNAKEVGAYLKLDSLIQKDVDTTSHFGIGRPVGYDGILSKANVGICFNEKDTCQSTRENVVLEEIIQSLGLIGDSYTYPGSLFFQNNNPAKSFTKLDEDVLSLLYEPSVPINYPRESFEKDFADVLFHVNTSEKIKAFLKEFPEDLYMSDDVEACFIGGELLKHPKEVEVYLYGSIQKDDWAIVKRAIVSINEISPNLIVKLANPSASEPDHGIVLKLKQINQQKETIQRTIEGMKGNDCMFPKLIKSKVLLSYNGSERSRNFRQESIIDALYFSLIQIPQDGLVKNIFEIRDDSVKFNNHYANLFRLIYSDEFVDGLKLSEFRDIKSTIAK